MKPKTAPKAQNRSRGRTITNAGYLFIAINFILGIFNIIIGLVSGSLAITSDAVHSFIDSITGLLVIISEKLAGHHKLTKHRAKIERLATIIIAFFIIITGIHILVESIQSIGGTESPDYSIPVLIVLLASLVLKYLLANYLQNTGRAIKSSVLIASGAETMNDAWTSIAVLLSAIIYLIFKINIEAYISIIIALIIIKVGLEFIFPHLSKHHHHHLEQNPDHDHCKKHQQKV